MTSALAVLGSFFIVSGVSFEFYIGTGFLQTDDCRVEGFMYESYFLGFIVIAIAVPLNYCCSFRYLIHVFLGGCGTCVPIQCLVYCHLWEFGQSWLVWDLACPRGFSQKILTSQKYPLGALA